MKIDNGKYGFTLIEVIAALVIIGILATIMSVGVGKIFQGYLLTKDNSETTMRAQLAVSRIMKELTSIDGVSSGSKTSITYSYTRNGVSIPNRTLSWAGSANAPLLLGGSILTQDIDDFELTYHTAHSDAGDNTWNGSEKMIGVTLKMTGALDVVSSFSIRVVPRNL